MAQVPLDRIVIQAAAIVLGLGAGLLAPALALDVPALLVAILCACLFDLIDSPWTRTTLLLITFGLLVVWKPFSAFGPLVACLAAASSHRSLRSLWIAPQLLNLRFFGLATACGLGCFSAVTCLLALRSERAWAEKHILLSARDGLRQQVMLMSEKEASQAAEAAGDEASAAPGALAGLTEREQSILSLVAEGLDNKEVAARLYLSEGTVRNHVSAILRKKQLHNRTQLVALYFRGPTLG